MRRLVMRKICFATFLILFSCGQGNDQLTDRCNALGISGSYSDNRLNEHIIEISSTCEMTRKFEGCEWSYNLISNTTERLTYELIGQSDLIRCQQSAEMNCTYLRRTDQIILDCDHFYYEGFNL